MEQNKELQLDKFISRIHFAAGDWGAGGHQGHRPHQTEQERPHPHGDQGHEGAATWKPRQF